MEPEPVEQETPVVEISSRAKRLSARNSDEVSSSRSKRVSARLSRNSSSEPQSRNSSSERSRRDSSPNVSTQKEKETDSEPKLPDTVAPAKEYPPKKGSPAKKDSPARKESPEKKESQPAKHSSPKTPSAVPKTPTAVSKTPTAAPKTPTAVPKKNSPKAKEEAETKTSHTLIIDDVVEFEVPKKTSPVKEKSDVKKEAPAIQMATTPILKPHKLELTEPEPVPITDTKLTKRGHSGCVDQVTSLDFPHFSLVVIILHPIFYTNSNSYSQEYVR